MTEQTIQSPWRDGTAEGELSADMFGKVVAEVLGDAPQVTRRIRDMELDPTSYIDSVHGADVRLMQKQHYDMLLFGLNDPKSLDLIDALSARVRFVAQRERQPVAV